MSANETRRLVALAQEFKDKMWHFELYQWYLENGLEQELLDITSTAGYVIEFLNSDSGRTGLLWKYYIRQGRNEKGISCLYEKAMSSSEGIPIERRIEYFSIILNLLRVLKDTTADQHMRTSEVLTNFELLKLQQEVLRVGDAGVLTEEERAELSTKALSFTELRSLVERKENYKFYVLSIEFIRLERSTASTLQKIRATYSGKILKDFNLPALVACAKRFYTEFTGDDSAADLYFPVEFVLETLTEQYYKNSEEFLTALLDLKSSKRSLCVPVFNFYARKFRAASGATGDNKRANDWLRWVAFIADHIASFTERDERTVGTVLNFISDLTTKKQNNQQVDQMILTSLADTRNKLLF